MAENNTNRTVMMLAGAVVVLLVVFVGVVVLSLNGGSKPATPGTTPGGSEVTTTGVGSSATFDPATATKVPADQTPKAYVTAYYQAILDKQWQKAFDMQPAASKVGKTVAAFQQTQEQMYGMTAFSIFSDTPTATEDVVVVRQELGTNGIWNTVWTFTKVNGAWLIKGRVVATGEPTK
jgi:hypothetical protein